MRRDYNLVWQRLFLPIDIDCPKCGNHIGTETKDAFLMFAKYLIEWVDAEGIIWYGCNQCGTVFTAGQMVPKERFDRVRSEQEIQIKLGCDLHAELKAMKG